MAQNYVLTLNSGDSYATYNIYYDAISISNFATLTVSGGNATQVSYTNMSQGVEITIPDSASQVIIVNLGDCKNQLTIAITPFTPPFQASNICISFEDTDSLLTDPSPWTFQPNGTQNGKTKWSYTGSTTNNVYNLVWNLTAQQWQIVVNSSTIFINSNSSQPPTGFWVSTNRGILNVSAVDGSCSTTAVRITNTNVVNTSCKGTTPCNGKVIITAAGGTPPYQYAISATPGNPNSITWSNSNIIQGLCEGTVNVVVKDSLGTLSQAQQSTVSFDELPKSYLFSVVQRLQQVTVNTQQPTRKVQGNSEWELQLDQQLDPGVTINFRLEIQDSNNLYEPYGQGTYSTITTLKKNNVILTPNTTTPIDYFNSNPDCRGFQIRTLGTLKYYDLTYQLGDVIEAVSVGNLEITNSETNSNNCVTAYDSEVLGRIIINPTTPITGCQCCDIASPKATKVLSLTTKTSTVITPVRE